MISKTCLLYSVHSKYNYMATYHSSHITSKLNIFYGYTIVHLDTDIQEMKCVTNLFNDIIIKPGTY